MHDAFHGTLKNYPARLPSYRTLLFHICAVGTRSEAESGVYEMFERISYERGLDAALQWACHKYVGLYRPHWVENTRDLP